MHRSSRRPVLIRWFFAVLAGALVVAGVVVEPATAVPGLSLTAGSPGTHAVVGTAYSYTYSASTSSTFSVSSGALPTGLTLDSSSGELSGTPVATGAFTFTVEATSGAATADSASTTILVSGAGYLMAAGGSQVLEIAPGGTPVSVVASIPGATAIGADGAGDLFVGSGNTVVEVPADGRAPFTYYTDTVNHTDVVDAITAGPTGDVFIAIGDASGSFGRMVVKKAAGTGVETTLLSSSVFSLGLALDSDGNLYVGDLAHQSVTEIYADGTTPNKVFATPSPSQPAGVAVDSRNDLFVNDSTFSGASTIVEFPAGAATSVSIGPAAQYAPLAVDATGDLFAPGGSGILEYTPSAGAPNGYSSSPYATGVGTPRGLAVIAPPVAAFTADGPGSHAAVGTPYSYTFKAAAPSTFSAAGALPAGLALDPTTGVLSGTPTTAGTYTFNVVASPDSALGGTVSPSITIVVSGPGTVFAGMPDSGMVHEIATYGDVTTLLSGLTSSFPAGVALDAANDVFVTVSGDGAVVEVPADGRPEFTFASGLDQPHSIAVGPDGSVYVGNEGSLVKIPAGGGSPAVIATGITPEGVAVDRLGNIYLANVDGGAIAELHADGSPQTYFDNVFPFGLAVDAVGDVFYTNQAETYVGEFLAGGGDPVPACVVVGDYNTVALDSAGRVFVANYGGQQVGTCATDGSYNLNPYATGLPGVQGIAVVPAPAPTLNALAAVPGAAVGQAFSYTFSASTAVGAPAPTFSVVSGSLPDGLSLDPATGVVSGTPTTAGSSTFTVLAHDAVRGQESAPVTIKVTTPVVVTVSGSQTYNGTPLFTTSQKVPDGLALDGSVSCTALAGRFPITPALPVDQYTINPSKCSGLSLSGTDAANYSISYAGGEFDVSPEGVTVTADDQSEVSGAADPVFTYSVSPQIALTTTPSCAVVGAHTVVSPPTYPITCSGADAGSNYSISYAAGTLTVTAPVVRNDAVLQVSAANDRSGSSNLDGSTVSGAIYVFANVPASDREVLFSLDGKVFHDEAAAPFDFNGTAVGNLATAFSTSSLADGPHTVTARVTTNAGVVSTVSASFTVANNAPVANQVLQVSAAATRAPSQNLDGATVSGPVYVFANVPSSDREVVFMLDGSPFHTEASAPFDFNGTATATTAYSYPSTSLTNGTHTVAVTIIDASGASSSALATFTVDNGGTVTPPPAVSPLRVSTSADRSNPVNLDGASLTGAVYIFDVPTSVAYTVQFSLDGKAYHFEGTAPFDFNGSGPSNALPYSLSGLTKGKHTVTATTALTNGKTETTTATFTVG